jgi:UDP-glucose 4-epimerase
MSAMNVVVTGGVGYIGGTVATLLGMDPATMQTGSCIERQR